MNDWLVNNENGVYYLTPPSSEFEGLYNAVRSLESRMHTDETVLLLPHLAKKHPHNNEWEKRKWTTHRFSQYIKEKKTGKVLEIGCGNGWFSNLIASHCTHVFALDVGREELEQAARCFPSRNIDFICSTDWSKLPDNTFDCIVFNASMQYFDLTPEFWKQLNRCLASHGEIHILDTPFYDKDKIEGAKNRSLSYFSKIGVEKANSYYKHLPWSDLPIHFELMYTPNKWMQKLNTKRSPFPWIRIHKFV